MKITLKPSYIYTTAVAVLFMAKLSFRIFDLTYSKEEITICSLPISLLIFLSRKLHREHGLMCL